MSTTPRTDAEDNSPLPSTPILTEEETSRQIRADADKYNPRIRQLELENTKLLEQNNQFRATLNSIACWKEGDTVSSWFDEPCSAEAARQALAGIPVLDVEKWKLLEVARAAKSDKRNSECTCYSDPECSCRYCGYFIRLDKALKSLEESGVKI